jgi:trigger factor
MKTEIVDVSQTRKEINIEIDADTLKQSYDQISDRYAKLATVPGFRRGHAPRSVVRVRFKDEIRSEVLREIVPQAVSDTILEHKLNVLGEPDIHLDDKEGSGKFGEQPVTVHVHVEVLPEIELGEYKGLEAVRRIRPVNESDIDRVTDGLREASASLQPVEDRSAEIGDTVTVNFDGTFVNEPEAEPIRVEEVDVELGGPNVQPEFTENLLGVKPDEVKSFRVKYPDDFTSKGLAGKEVDYTAAVTAVRRKELPELDDEFARSLGEEFDSVATLRGKVNEDLSQRSKMESDSRLRNALIGQLVGKHQFEVPQILLDHQTDLLLETLLRDMFSRGIDPRNQPMDWESLREQLKGQAERDVRASLLLDRVADQENIEVTNAEIEAEIAAIAAGSRQSEEQVRAALTKQGGERSIADRLRNRRALDLLVENARVTDEDWREESPEPANPESVEESPSSSANNEQQTVAAESGNT